jgi:hypothetical protein
MNAEARKAELNKLKANENNVSMTGIPLSYRGSTQTEKVYRIPLAYLIYNKYNGRIGTEVKSYEKQNGILDPEIKDDSTIIENFLYYSKKERNEKTMKSLYEDGQRRYGIVTADGVIIDGNRRAMLLNRLFNNHAKLEYTYSSVERCQYFLAIILPEDAEEKDLQQLETVYQMGEDDKLDYNPIEKYLKCKELKRFFDETKIADMMNEKESQIIDWLSILSVMEEYLDTYEYNGIYTRLEKTEGPFVDLNNYVKSYQGHNANTRNVDWDYSDSDISDLKTVCFDYIRARYEGKEFREIAKTGKDGSIFQHEKLWKEFLQEHIDKIPSDMETVDELREKYPAEDLSKLLKSRDDEWTAGAKGQLEGNLRRYTSKLEDKRVSNKPAELIEKALSALRAVDCDQNTFLDDPIIEEMVYEINSMTYEMKKLLKKK